MARQDNPRRTVKKRTDLRRNNTRREKPRRTCPRRTDPIRTDTRRADPIRRGTRRADPIRTYTRRADPRRNDLRTDRQTSTMCIMSSIFSRLLKQPVASRNNGINNNNTIMVGSLAHITVHSNRHNTSLCQALLVATQKK